MPSFLSLFAESYNRSPRPTRFAQCLRGLGEVTVCAVGGEDAARSDGMGFIPLAERPKNLPAKALRALTLLARRYERDIWNGSTRAAFEALRDSRFDCIVCHTIKLLPLACFLRALPQNAGRCKIVMDAREFYPREFENSMAWRMFLGGLNDYLCRRYLPQADLVFTVSPGLQQGYVEEYGIECRLLPSYPAYAALEPHATPAVVRCVHHGMASPGRKLELMIETIRLLGGRFSLDFLLLPATPGYLETLRQQAADIPCISFHDPVPMPEIVPHIARYDMGLFLLEPNTFNHRHALPNKLFEFIQARLAVAIGPSPDMAELVRAHEVGVVSPDFTPESFAATLGALRPEDINGFKAKAHAAAKTLCRERNDEVIAQSLRELLV